MLKTNTGQNLKGTKNIPPPKKKFFFNEFCTFYWLNSDQFTELKGTEDVFEE